MATGHHAPVLAPRASASANDTVQMTTCYAMPLPPEDVAILLAATKLHGASHPDANHSPNHAPHDAPQQAPARTQAAKPWTQSAGAAPPAPHAVPPAAAAAAGGFVVTVAASR